MDKWKFYIPWIVEFLKSPCSKSVFQAPQRKMSTTEQVKSARTIEEILQVLNLVDYLPLFEKANIVHGSAFTLLREADLKVWLRHIDLTISINVCSGIISFLKVRIFGKLWQLYQKSLTILKNYLPSAFFLLFWKIWHTIQYSTVRGPTLWLCYWISTFKTRINTF